jgi:2-haloacid dehalogenase
MRRSQQLPSQKPHWLTFDCYGTLIQWDEGLLAAVTNILAKNGGAPGDANKLIAIYDHHEHALEQARPHRSFRTVAGKALALAMADLGLAFDPADVEILTGSIGSMPPFPEVVESLSALKQRGYKLCIISNTDDAIIAGNVAQLGGSIDRVITAEQAQAYKPSPAIFSFAHQALGVGADEIVHICASPHLDLAAARDGSFAAIWIDRGSGRKPLPDFTPAAVFPRLDGVIPFLDRAFGSNRCFS